MRRTVGLSKVLATSSLALIAAACADTASPGASLHGMRLRGSASVVHDSITGAAAVRAVLTATNLADTTAQLFWGECPSNGPLVVFVSRSDDAPPVWNAMDGYRRLVCSAVGHSAEVAPGQSWQHTTTIPVQDILGDSLPAGSYRITGSAKWLGPGFPDELALGELQLPAR